MEEQLIPVQFTTNIFRHEISSQALLNTIRHQRYKQFLYLFIQSETKHES